MFSLLSPGRTRYNQIYAKTNMYEIFLKERDLYEPKKRET